MSENMKDKVIIITGAGTGLGRETALLLAHKGAKVIVSDFNAEEGEKTSADIIAADGAAEFIPCDVSKTADIVALHQKVINTHGRIDGALNNAGIAGKLGLAVADYPEDLFDQVIAVNLKGVWLCMREQINQMLTQKSGGSIVNMASAAGLIGLPNGAYTASKHGVVGLTKSASLNYSKDGVRVNAVCPGYVYTPATAPALDRPEVMQALVGQHPIGRLGEMSEIAEAVLWLLSDSSSFVTGHAMPVDGGLTSV
jgi:NAD(P)-dependent dehydrogenase (short-subunit alcohol dehydrogenase family)